MAESAEEAAAIQFAKTLATQSWASYGVGMLLILMRIYARIHRLGLRNLQIDDYLMLTAGCWYTILITCLNLIVVGGGSNLYPPELYPTFSPEDVQERIKGSKIVVLSEQAMLNVIYTIKVCLLLMYTRLTLHHTQQKMVRYLAIYVLIGWTATQIAFFSACRPFKGYWAMPPPNPQCTTLEHYAIVQAVFNISSDIFMLFIPLPLVTRLSIHWKQKVVLTTIFGMGVFVIVAAVLTKIFNLSDVYSSTYMLWYMREASVAVYVSNLPMIWPLLREYVPFLRNLTPVKGSTSRARTYGLGTNGGRSNFATQTVGSTKSRMFPVADGVTTLVTVRGKDEEDCSSVEVNELGVMQRQGSEDRLRPPTGSDEHDIGFAGKGGIHVGTTVQVTEEHIAQPPDVRIARGAFTQERYIEEVDRQQHAFEWEQEKGRR